MAIEISKLIQMSKEERAISNQARKRLSENHHGINGNFIALFGRQFNPTYRFNSALKPLWAGFYISYKGLELMVDPGINILQRAERIGVNLALTNTLFISHAHIDHANDANVIAEMAAYRENSNLRILMSKHTQKEKIMSHYHSQNVTELVLIDKIKEIYLGNNINLKPIKVTHSIGGSFGFVLDLNGLRIGYTGDTGFNVTYKTIDGRELSAKGNIPNKKEIEEPGAFDEKLKEVFSNVDLLVFNLHDLEFRKHTKHNLYHSTASDAIEVLRDSKVKYCFLEHFNPHGCLGPEYPQKVNQYIKESSGKETILVALNGHVVNLDNM